MSYLEFIRKALQQGIRLDGRRLEDFQDTVITLTRNETTSSSYVTLGGTQVITVVKGSIVSPYIDRPTEGILNINVDTSIYAHSSSSISESELTRFLERSIRDSESIDLESLCLVAGRKVWLISCDVKILDYQGSAIDACVLSCMSALRAHRRAEVTVDGDNLKVYHSDEREPLPLALYHTPLALTIGLFIPLKNEDKVLRSISHYHFCYLDHIMSIHILCVT